MRTDRQGADPRAVCFRKKAYDLRRAEKVAGRVRNRTGEHVVAYACTHCGQYHVGHPTEDEA